MKIPVVKSQRQITDVAPTQRVATGLVKKVSREAFTTPSRSMQLIGATVEKVAQHFEEAQTLHETTVAKTKAIRRLRELEAEAAQTPDVFDIQTFQDRIAAIQEETSSEITLPRARANFQKDYNRFAISTDFNIRSTLRERQTDAETTAILEHIDELRDRDNRENELDLLLKQGVDKLLWDKEWAYNKEKATLVDWQKSDIQNAIAENPELAKKQLKEGTLGGLTQKELNDWLDEADKEIENNKAIADKKVQEFWFANTAKILKGFDQISKAEIINMAAMGEIDPKIATGFIKAKDNKALIKFNPNKKENKKAWMEIVKNSVSPEQDLRKQQETLIERLSNGLITAEDAGKIAVMQEKLFEKAINFQTKPNRFEQSLRWAMDAISHVGGIIGGTDIVERMYRALFEKTEGKELKEEEVEEITKEIIEGAQKEVNPSRAQYKLNDMIPTPLGIAKVIGFDVDGEPILDNEKIRERSE